MALLSRRDAETHPHIHKAHPIIIKGFYQYSRKYRKRIYPLIGKGIHACIHLLVYKLSTKNHLSTSRSKMRADVGGHKENLLTKEANHGSIYMN